MNRRGSIPPAFLAEAIEAGRRVLRSLDQEDVPVPLRKVAASSAKRLPPPLLVSLLDYLDDSEWLRDAALEAWAEADAEDPDPRRAVAALYLTRPDGWEARVASRVETAGEATSGRELEEARRAVTRLERIVEQLEERLEASEAAAASLRAQVEASFAARIDRVEGQRHNAQMAARDAEQRTREAHSLANALEHQLAEADRRIEDLRARLQRRERSEAEPHRVGFGRGAPIDIARDLDRMLAAFREGSGERSERTPAAPFGLPAGVRPDDPAAVDWLIGQQQPTSVLVDGHNVAHDLQSPPGVETRRRVEEALVRVRRMAAAPLSIRLFWDSAEAQEQWPVRGLDVQYVPSADDAIVEAASRGGPSVIITSDAELRERAQGPDVVALWGRALSGWIDRGRQSGSW